MNRLEDLIGAAFEEDARHAPEAGPVLTRVLAFEAPRRRRRAGWLATAAVAAATAAIVAVGVAQVGEDNLAGTTTLTGSGGFEQRRLAYAEGSSIHYGDRTIDVAPHQPIALVQTDDGFVFATAPDADGYDVYLANGNGVERIGQAGGFTDNGVTVNSGSVIVSDDAGSYVGWVDHDDAVVYDTARHAEALRTPIPYPEEGEPGARSVAAIDGESAYVASLDSVDVWDLSTGTEKTSITRQGVFPDVLSDVANGYFLWTRLTEPVASVVSSNPYAEQPSLPDMVDGFLSADAGYVAGGGYRVLARETLEDVTPKGHGVVDEAILQWLDEDRYVADTTDQASDGGVEPHDLLICSVAAETCRVAVQSVGEVVYPDGNVPPWAPTTDEE